MHFEYCWKLHLDEEDNSDTSIKSPIADQDNPEPFMVNEKFHADDVDLSHVPLHSLIIYMVVSWLDLPFHLFQVACQALLVILGCIMLALQPSLSSMLPFITLQLSHCVLGVDKPIITLPVCPSCLNVFPPAGSLHMQETCCDVPLFLSNQTKQGNSQARIPVIKYPYLPLLMQIPLCRYDLYSKFLALKLP